LSTQTSNRFQQGFVLLLLATVLLGFIGMIRGFLIALVLAAILTGLLYPIYRRIRVYLKDQASLASVVTLLLLGLAAGLPLVVFTGMVTSEAIQINEQVRPAVESALASDKPLTERLPDWLPFKQKLEPYQDIIINKASEAAGAIGRWLISHLSTVTQGTLNFFLGLFVMLYAMFYFFIHGPRFLRSLESLLPLSKEDKELVMSRGLDVTQASLKSILVIGSAQGVLVGLAFWTCGLNGPAFWGSIVFLLSAIPGLGAPLIWLPAAIYLIATGSIGWGIGLAVWGVLVVGLVDNLLRPRLIGHDTKLPDIIILISILGGITTFGPIGIILGPVIAAVLDTVLNIYRRLFSDFMPS